MISPLEANWTVASMFWGAGSTTPFACDAPRRSRWVTSPKSSGQDMKGFMIAVMNPMTRSYMGLPRSAVPDSPSGRAIPERRS